MASPLRLGAYALGGLLAVKLLAGLVGLDTLSDRLLLGPATAEEAEGPDTPAETPDPAALPELLAAIAAEREALDARTAALDAREAEIALARATVLKQNEELTRLRTDVEALLEQARSTEEADISRLVRIYEAMKPSEAATILQDSDLELTVLVLAAMAERNAGPIMAAMSPVRASAVSRILLERSRLPGDQVPVVVPVN
ncbi:MotE family protein [Tabrizicola sp.]|uniref:MotE family protein n=1 Tax=Tabrizicola sp. TaxID=2005166 RepID=UPI0035B1CF3B